MEHNLLPPALPRPNCSKDAPTHIALYAAALALLCAIALYPSAASMLAGDGAFGASASICAPLVYAAFFLSMRGQQDVRRGWPLFLVTLPLSACYALYSVPELIFLNSCALAVLMPLHLSLMAGASLDGTSLAGRAGYELFARPFAYIPQGTKAAVAGTGKKGLRTALLCVAGAAIAAPALLLVVALLMFADLRFEALVERLIGNIDIAQLFLTAVMAAAMLFPMLSALYSLSLGKKIAVAQPPAGARRTIPAAPIYTVLCMFSAVLLLFALVQLRHFGDDLLLGPRAYAQRAHESFFPMAFAAAICYGVQWFCLRFISHKGRALRILAAALSAGLFVLIATAMRSILSYQATYGMTRLRIYVTVFIAALFLSLALTLLRLWLAKLPYRALLCGILAVSLLFVNFINLDRTIAEYNLSGRFAGEADMGYLLSLSADSLAVIAEQHVAVAPREMADYRERIAHQLALHERSARTWNLGRARLYGAVPR